jgi:hypothetical protein
MLLRLFVALGAAAALSAQNQDVGRGTELLCIRRFRAHAG